MGKSILRRTKFRRALTYLSGTYLAVFSALVIPALGIWRTAHGWLISGLVAGLLLIILRNYLEYGRIIYDPHWAMNFQDRFDKMDAERNKAAKVLRERKKELGNVPNRALDDIDDVLDFLEDVGLYQRADFISPELAHHHFFHWVRGYWQAAGPYIHAWREKEPERWKHVEELFDTVCDIEGGCQPLNDTDLDDFLQQEIGDTEQAKA